MDIRTMKVSDLKEELKKLGLDTTGLKAALAERLAEARLADAPTEGVDDVVESPVSQTTETQPPEEHVPPVASNDIEGSDVSSSTQESTAATTAADVDVVAEDSKKRKLPDLEADATSPEPVPETTAAAETIAATAATMTTNSAPSDTLPPSPSTSSTVNGGAPKKRATRPTPKDVTRAQWWYYLDEAGTKQGPQYPGPMRDWFFQGYFTEAAPLVAPSFSGEIPLKDVFKPIKDTFGAPLGETAFVSAPGIALYPPESLPSLIYDDDEGEGAGKPAAGAAWLEEKLEDMRALPGGARVSGRPGN